ncbi:MAG: carboxylating nicotinate-nucleotide diphosphorylase [Candidatus Limnocylindrales bacterium]
MTTPAPTPAPDAAPTPAPDAAPTPTPRKIRPPDPAAVARVVAAALAEDLALGDPTSEGLFGPDDTCRTTLLQKEPGVVCGLSLVAAVFAELDPRVVVTATHADGDRIETVPAEVARIAGPSRAVLAGERTALNLLARLSGIATLAARCVAELEGTGAILLDTRKTTAGLRELEKYAVRCGGASNHRLNLGEALLVKDNHLRLVGGIAAAVARLHEAHSRLRLEVEAETLDDVREALKAGVNRILLDNMSIHLMRKAVALCHSAANGAVETEASGGITLANLRRVGETGVDYISMGALTHSPRALDVSLEVAP